MEDLKRRWERLGRMTMVGLFLLVLASAPAWAGSKLVDGIKVKYPYDFDADYNEEDETLTIVIYEGGGKLTVKALPGASEYWGDYVDVNLVADCVYVPALTFKGRSDLPFYITGQVGATDKLSIVNGSVGGTWYYEDVGLGVGYDHLPSVISIKNGVAYGSVLGEVFFGCEEE